MKQLKDILKIFSDNRIKYLSSHTWATMSEDDRVNAVKEWAEPVAKKIINEGYFRIGNHYCIRVDILELYYNERAEGEKMISQPRFMISSTPTVRALKRSTIFIGSPMIGIVVFQNRQDARMCC